MVLRENTGFTGMNLEKATVGGPNIPVLLCLSKKSQILVTARHKTVPYLYLTGDPGKLLLRLPLCEIRNDANFDLPAT
jgi:hypothetical protein